MTAILDVWMRLSVALYVFMWYVCVCVEKRDRTIALSICRVNFCSLQPKILLLLLLVLRMKLRFEYGTLFISLVVFFYEFDELSSILFLFHNINVARSGCIFSKILNQMWPKEFYFCSKFYFRSFFWIAKMFFFVKFCYEKFLTSAHTFYSGGEKNKIDSLCLDKWSGFAMITLMVINCFSNCSSEIVRFSY